MFYFSLILDNEMDKKFLVESNNDYNVLPATEQVFINQIQRLNDEINDRKLKQNEAEFRLKGIYIKCFMLLTVSRSRYGFQFQF